ncbi:hypothetical protein HZ326_27584 [Fusarium oxysporum f. sp. albedinis]|nr:hypothetical protein HZ326_27584 [Fusarium oxysporum f. sp. albedinis]
MRQKGSVYAGALSLKSSISECHSPSGASQQGYTTNQKGCQPIEIAELDGYTAKEVAQLQEKTALSTALAAKLLSPSCTWGQNSISSISLVPMWL